ARDPGTRATVLVALATTAASAGSRNDRPASSAGKVSRVPPPAIEFTAPAASAARQSQASPQDRSTSSASDTNLSAATHFGGCPMHRKYRNDAIHLHVTPTPIPSTVSPRRKSG